MNYHNERLESHNPGAKRILVVDGSEDARLLMNYHLQRLGYLVGTASNGVDALKMLENRPDPHAIILELMTHKMSGFKFAEHVRRFTDVPIIVLSALNDTSTKVAALEQFAEDYVTKPFEVAELAARIGRVLNRRQSVQTPKSEIKIDEGLSLNLEQQYAVLGNESVPLTHIESRILRVLCDNRGRAVSSSFLLSKVWTPDQRCTVPTLRVHIFRVRSKVEAEPATPHYVKTIRGHGYRLA